MLMYVQKTLGDEDGPRQVKEAGQVCEIVGCRPGWPRLVALASRFDTSPRCWPGCAKDA